jgi:hypothetical protein
MWARSPLNRMISATRLPLQDWGQNGGHFRGQFNDKSARNTCYYEGMKDSSSDTKADIIADMHNGEMTSLMGPLLPSGDSHHQGELNDLAIELTLRSARTN